MANAKTIPGFYESAKDHRPPPSTTGFFFPHRANPAQAAAFRTSFLELLTERGIDFHKFAEEFFGVRQTAAGGKSPIRLGTARYWAKGKTFPRQHLARGIAAYFKVPLERLITPGGKMPAGGHGDPEDAPTRAKPGPKPGGWGGKRVLPAPPERLQLPEGAKPATVKFETHPADPRFATIEVKGTLQMDHVLSLVAILHS